MGMDVCGHNPAAPEDEYFGRNVWSWHPLADLCCELAPEESQACEQWHFNDGFGMGGPQSVRLAERLEQLVSDGTAAAYVKQYSPESTYHLNLEDVTDFIAFLRVCGGFTIL
jgi:hypothetical protein